MRAKLFLAVLALSAAPGLAMAACSGYGHEEVTMSCPEGQSFDADTQTCKPPATG